MSANSIAKRRALVFEGYRLERETRRLVGPDGEAVALQPRLFDLLAFLLERPGEIVAKQAIMDAVWPDVTVDDNSLNQAVSALRRAVGDRPDEPRFIATVPRRGYQFVAAVRADEAPARVETAAVALGFQTRRPRPALLAGLALAITAIAILTVFAARRSMPSPASSEEPSIAVLAFEDMSAEGDQAYFSDGVAEEILNQLARIDGLRVTSRTSSFAFKGERADARTIGRTLGVTHLLEGSVRKAGDDLRVVAQLIDASDGSHVWSQSYDRRLDDVFAIQEEIALAVTDALSVTLGVAPRPVGGTQNVEAYDAFLRARSWINLVTTEGSTQAADALREAIAHDPSFVDAHLMLSDLLFRGAGLAPPERFPELRAESAASLERARSLAPDYWRVLEATAQRRAAERDWAGAVEAARRAREAAPASEKLCHGPALTPVLESPDAHVRCAQARFEADPLSLSALVYLHDALTAAGRSDDAAQAYARSRVLPGRSPLMEYSELFRVTHDGAPEQVRAQYARMRGLPAVDGPFYGELSRLTEDRAASLAFMRESFENPLYDDNFKTNLLGRTAVAYEDHELAVAVWRRLASRPGFVPDDVWSTYAAPTRRLPAFKDFVREMGFVDYWRESGNWGEFCRPLGADDFECR